MDTLVKDVGIQTLHDQVVSEVAQRWAKAFRCKVTIRTESDLNPWADPRQQSDIAGWAFSPQGDRVLWLGEVETSESLRDSGTHRKWVQSASAGVPMYLFIPRGLRTQVESITAALDVPVTGLYEYSLVNGAVQVS